MTVLRKLITGCTPLKIGTHQIQWEPGLIANATCDAYMDFSSSNTLSISSVGTWGLDRALWVGWAHAWGIQKSSDGTCAIVLSPEFLGTPFYSYLSQQSWASGYDRIRKLPAAWYIAGSSAGMRQQFLEAWPWPTTFAYTENDSTYDLIFDTGNQWERRSLSTFMPLNARIAYLDVRAEYDGADGNVIVRTPGSGDGGLKIRGTLTSTDSNPRKIIVSSSQADPPVAIEVATSNDTKARIRVVGFGILETY